MTIDKIRNNINRNLGNNIKVIHNEGRNKIYESTRITQKMIFQYQKTTIARYASIVNDPTTSLISSHGCQNKSYCKIA